MAFTDREVEEAILAKRWETDCVDITLTQNDVPAPRIYRGRGYLRQDSEGVVNFHVYPPMDGEPEGAHDFNSSGAAGRLLAPSAYYTLSAIDWYGRVWTSDRVICDISTTYCSGEPYGIVFGQVRELKSEKKDFCRSDNYHLRMVWNVELSIPCTASTEVVTRLGSKESRSGSLNAAIFDFDSGKFTIHTSPKQLYLEFGANRTPHSYFYIRVMEAMSFVVGRRLGWNYAEELRDGTKTIRLRGNATSDEKSLMEPVTSTVMDHRDDTWRLFVAYLRFILTTDGGNLHPCTMELFRVYQARQGTIEAQALALGVSVEGLCKCLFPRSNESETKLKGWVKELRQHCQSWCGFSDPAAHSALSGRLSGLIGTLLNVRAKDTLMELVEQKAVAKKLVDAWTQLRNLAAHASLRADSMQELIDLCATNAVLVYHLIFKAIGYTGKYSDYSEHGHPLKDYGVVTITQSEACPAQTATEK